MDTLTSILSSKTRADIFTNLFGIELISLHLRELERRCSCNVNTLRQELKKLLCLDLVKSRRDGNRLYYCANQDHPIFSEIHSIVLKTSGIVPRLKKELLNTDVKLAFIFGSIANGTETGESDVDLFVIGNIKSRDLSARLMEISTEIGREINYFILSEKEFINRRNSDDHFLNNVLNNEKNFIIGTPDELETMA